MDTLQAIRERRAVKHFDPNHMMPDEDKKALFDHAILAPSSFNIQNWRLVSIEDPDLKKDIRAAAWDQAQITDASLTLVLCADVKSWAKSPERYWADAPKEVSDILVPMIGQFYDGREWQQRDEAMRSTGIIAQTIMLAAKAMGYDSCPMIGLDADAVGKLINLPEDHVVGMVVVVGKPIKPANVRGGQLPVSDVVITDRF